MATKVFDVFNFMKTIRKQIIEETYIITYNILNAVHVVTLFQIHYCSLL